MSQSDFGLLRDAMDHRCPKCGHDFRAPIKQTEEVHLEHLVLPPCSCWCHAR